MATQMFLEFLQRNNLKIDIIQSELPTRTAQEAADTHNVPVSNIVKSLLTKVEDRYILFLVPGDKRLELEEIKKRLDLNEIRMANADEVKLTTGYSIGGVPPFGHITQLETHIEDGFDSNNEIVAAAGSGNSIFKCTLDKLKEIIDAKY